MSTRKLRYRALASKILVVAVEGSAGDWAAYIGTVRGKNHDKEFTCVQECGEKLPQRFAEILFPDFKYLKWRD
jgi:hypothetical protein